MTCMRKSVPSTVRKRYDRVCSLCHEKSELLGVAKGCNISNGVYCDEIAIAERQRSDNETLDKYLEEYLRRCLFLGRDAVKFIREEKENISKETLLDLIEAYDWLVFPILTKTPEGVSSSPTDAYATLDRLLRNVVYRGDPDNDPY